MFPAFYDTRFLFDVASDRSLVLGLGVSQIELYPEHHMSPRLVCKPPSVIAETYATGHMLWCRISP